MSQTTNLGSLLFYTLHPPKSDNHFKQQKTEAMERQSGQNSWSAKVDKIVWSANVDKIEQKKIE